MGKADTSIFVFGLYMILVVGLGFMFVPAWLPTLIERTTNKIIDINLTINP